MEAGEGEGRREPDKTKLFFFNLFPTRDGMIAARVNTGQARLGVSNDCNQREPDQDILILEILQHSHSWPHQKYIINTLQPSQSQFIKGQLNITSLKSRNL